MVKDDILILDTVDIQSRLIILILSYLSSMQTSYQVCFSHILSPWAWKRPETDLDIEVLASFAIYICWLRLTKLKIRYITFLAIVGSNAAARNY